MEICQRPIVGSAERGLPCQECGHSDYVHPGVPNPALSECVVCALLVLMDEVKQAAQAHFG